MKEELLNKAKLWQVEYKRHDYKPKYIFKNSESKIETLFSLSFFLSIMSIETLFNQPFKKKIKIVHNKFYKTIFLKR